MVHKVFGLAYGGEFAGLAVRSRHLLSARASSSSWLMPSTSSTPFFTVMLTCLPSMLVPVRYSPSCRLHGQGVSNSEMRCGMRQAAVSSVQRTAACHASMSLAVWFHTPSMMVTLERVAKSALNVMPPGISPLMRSERRSISSP